MKTFTLFSLIFLSSCGELLRERDDAQGLCRTVEEMRAICFVEEMARLGHDPNMSEWVIDWCKIQYPVRGCWINPVE
jgi:hypothetical protein